MAILGNTAPPHPQKNKTNKTVWYGTILVIQWKNKIILSRDVNYDAMLVRGASECKGMIWLVSNHDWREFHAHTVWNE